ncbi:hypothetical protein KG112_01595 [Nocardioides sp. zg-ZUI104]|uniref:hypothetical protein n=1 Tax=Nocardioides faecalis TaxID=2803858 RepID=UPI001BCDA177|nr:hypothetical protein [Nocardioides faecalis]MBS4751499.1 hypothetical protein [Nocardioides faecalis]
MPRRLLSLPTSAAAAGLVLAAVPLSPSAPASAGVAAAAPSACAADEVTVLVDPNELGGPTRTACAAAGTASYVFDEAGFELSGTGAPGMQGYVCRIDGLPEDGRCVAGDSYWSLWWAEPGTTTWAYAGLGVNGLELEPGAWVGFAWHEGEGKAPPPDVTLPGAGAEATADDEVVAADQPDAKTPAADDDSGPPTGLLIGAAVVVLAAAAVVPLRRRTR